MEHVTTESKIEPNLEKAIALMEDVEEGKFYSQLNDSIKALIEQGGYKKVELKKPWNTYYAKQDESGESSVFIDYILSLEERRTYGNRYGFAKVKPGKLEEFCERLNQADKDNANPPLTAGGLFIGAGLGSILSILGKQAYCNIKGVEYFFDPMFDPLSEMMIMGFLGAIFGTVVIGLPYAKLKRMHNEKKLGKCCSFLTPDSKESLKLAFGEKQ